MANVAMAPEDAADPYMPDFNEEPFEEARIGPSLLVRSLAEFFGTFILVLVGLLAALFTGAYGMLGVGLAFGLAMLAGATAFGHVSGAHLNPAVTLGAAAAGRFRWLDTIPYIFAQLIGAIAAGATTLVVVNGTKYLLEDSSTGETKAVGDVFQTLSNGFEESSATQTTTLATALVLQAVLTLIFVFVYLGATDKMRRMPSAPIAIGLSFGVLVMVTLAFTNGGLNPARSTATALFAGFSSEAIKQLWVFWLAPIVGGLLAGLVYPVFGSPRAEEYVEYYEDDSDDEDFDEVDIIVTEDSPAALVSDDAEETALDAEKVALDAEETALDAEKTAKDEKDESTDDSKKDS